VNYHNNHDELGWKVTLTDTGTSAMTGARIARIKDFVQDDDFMLTYGDGVCDVNIDSWLSFINPTVKY
jgi:glucose-1-phosphate cytidylyltransferase